LYQSALERLGGGRKKRGGRVGQEILVNYWSAKRGKNPIGKFMGTLKTLMPKGMRRPLKQRGLPGLGGVEVATGGAVSLAKKGGREKTSEGMEVSPIFKIFWDY